MIGPFRGATGHDRHTREFVRHLVRQGTRVQLTPLAGWSADLPEEVRETWFDDLRAPIDAEIALHFTMPTLCRPRAGMRNVNYTMFEADRIPREWAHLAAQHDRIVVPTKACRAAWMAGGIAESKLRIAPLAVDGDFFAQRATPLLALPHTHRFLNIADLRPRKNHLGLLRTWARATRRDDDAVLILKCPSHPRTLLADAVPLQDAAPVVFVTELLTDVQLRALYRSATHYISMSFGEGWDFPTMEAAVSGLQLIAPRHTSYIEYLGDTDASWIPSMRVPAVIEGRTGAEDRRWFDGTFWWRPEEDAAAAILRGIIDGSLAAHASPAEQIRRAHRWEAAAKRLREVLEEI